MMVSPELMRYHDGIVAHAAAVDGVANAAVDAARWVAHSRVALSRGTLDAKESTKTYCRR